MLGDNGFERVPTVPTVQSACDRDVQAKAYLLTFGSGGKRVLSLGCYLQGMILASETWRDERK